MRRWDVLSQRWMDANSCPTRSFLQVYTDFISEFVDSFSDMMGDVVTEITVGMGPAGELRYPAYPEGDRRWRFPGVGEFQCYDQYMLSSLRAAANDIGEPDWYGLSLMLFRVSCTICISQQRDASSLPRNIPTHLHSAHVLDASPLCFTRRCMHAGAGAVRMTQAVTIHASGRRDFLAIAAVGAHHTGTSSCGGTRSRFSTTQTVSSALWRLCSVASARESCSTQWITCGPLLSLLCLSLPVLACMIHAAREHAISQRRMKSTCLLLNTNHTC